MIAEADKRIKGVFVITPEVHEDTRGYFFESFNEKEFNEKTGADFHPVQDNESKSTYGVLRGLHFQNPPFEQAKLVRVVDGEVLDVAVDLREGSPTKGQFTSAILTKNNKRQFFIPKGFAHGFLVLSPMATFQYKCDNYYTPEAENGIAWDDRDISINWLMPIYEITLSSKDMHRQSYKQFIEKRNDKD